MDNKDKKFRNLPAIMTLLAGFITSIIAIICRFSLVRTLWTLVVIMVVFFIIGMVVRIVLDKSLILPEPEKEEEKETGEEEQDKEENQKDKDAKDGKGEQQG